MQADESDYFLRWWRLQAMREFPERGTTSTIVVANLRPSFWPVFLIVPSIEHSLTAPNGQPTFWLCKHFWYVIYSTKECHRWQLELQQSIDFLLVHCQTKSTCTCKYHAGYLRSRFRKCNRKFVIYNSNQQTIYWTSQVVFFVGSHCLNTNLRLPIAAQRCRKADCWTAGVNQGLETQDTSFFVPWPTISTDRAKSQSVILSQFLGLLSHPLL